ncbi:MAG: phage protein GemA/Gp16 family protein [Thermodesulfobacteriota bacterium]
MIPSTKKQRQLIAIGCSRVGIDADTRHEMLMERFGVDSSTKLTRVQAALFLKELASRGFKIQGSGAGGQGSAGAGDQGPGKVSRKIRRTAGNVVRIASREQSDKIAAVAALIRWEVADGYDRWLKKRMGLDRIRTAYDAWRVIEGLKKLFENQMKKEFGPGWWTREYGDPGIELYVREHKKG